MSLGVIVMASWQIRTWMLVFRLLMNMGDEGPTQPRDSRQGTHGWREWGTALLAALAIGIGIGTRPDQGWPQRRRKARD